MSAVAFFSFLLACAKCPHIYILRNNAPFGANDSCLFVLKQEKKKSKTHTGYDTYKSKTKKFHAGKRKWQDIFFFFVVVCKHFVSTSTKKAASTLAPKNHTSPLCNTTQPSIINVFILIWLTFVVTRQKAKRQERKSQRTLEIYIYLVPYVYVYSNSLPCTGTYRHNKATKFGWHSPCKYSSKE